MVIFWHALFLFIFCLHLKMVILIYFLGSILNIILDIWLYQWYGFFR